MIDDGRLVLQPGERAETRMIRFRTLGCYPLTGAIESKADTLQGIIAELAASRRSERQGRLIDRDRGASMEAKKQEGYF
jgi:sulfate adenylyltransferase subunit 2